MDRTREQVAGVGSVAIVPAVEPAAWVGRVVAPECGDGDGPAGTEAGQRENLTTAEVARAMSFPVG